MIYLLEDDSSIRELVLYTLKQGEYEAEGFDHPDAFWKAMEKELPDLILLDIMLPEQDGIAILSLLREDVQTANIPVMMLTAKGSEYDKVSALDLGADDYLAKPFGMMEMMARVRALLRRNRINTRPETIVHGDLILYLGQHIVTVNDERIHLTFKEFNLLELLLENKGQVFNRDQLLNRIWGYDFDGESRTVDVHIRTLRQKLGDAGAYIETVRGVGYRIGAQV
ncbi:MAG: response regulator transcription factor [Eubacteriaceae bacterium]|jgi:two-component system alkaline phosphatase synthesis response regulator PhoP|nr:response regulator transcription factor [Eubacteriaceae bacterium]